MSKKINKRLDNKSLRQKTRQAIHGDYSKTARSDKWNVRMNQPPIVNDVMPHKTKKKKPSPQKAKCPVNGKHEWYKEWVTEHVRGISSVRTEDGWRWEYDKSKDYEVYNHIATCIHCWEQKRLKQEYERSWRIEARKRLKLKKRPVQF